VSRHSDNAREKIIDVAEQVVIENGARHLSFDAVAAKSGISRGGLLHHFSGKETLLKAMLDRRVKRATQNREQKPAFSRPDQKSTIAAKILGLEGGHEQIERTHVGLLAAIAHDPQLPVPYQQDFKNNLHKFCRGGLSVDRAAVILLAVEGMKLLELFSLLTFTPRDRNRIIREIMSLAEKERHA